MANGSMIAQSRTKNMLFTIDSKPKHVNVWCSCHSNSSTVLQGSFLMSCTNGQSPCLHHVFTMSSPSTMGYPAPPPCRRGATTRALRPLRPCRRPGEGPSAAAARSGNAPRAPERTPRTADDEGRKTRVVWWSLVESEESEHPWTKDRARCVGCVVRGGA